MSTPVLSAVGPNPPGSKVYRLLRDFRDITEAHFEGRLPSSLAQRIAQDTGGFYPLPQAERAMTIGYDLASGIVHGYGKRPEILDSWAGVGFTSLVDHAVVLGGFPVAVPLFGLDEEVAAIVSMRSIGDMAGAARLAVKGAAVRDVPSYEGGAKYPASAAPALSASISIRKSLMFAAFPQFVPLIELMGDVDVDVMHAALQRIRVTRGGLGMDIGEIAALMVRAEREKLPLDECLRVWSLAPGQTNLVLAAVRDGVPDEYLLQLHGAGIDSGAAIG